MIEVKTWRSHTFREACRYAWRGVRLSFFQERNIRLQFVGFITALFFGVWLGLSALELAVILLVSALVIVLEMTNSAVELLANAVQPKYNVEIRNLKDIMAGAVFVSSLAAIFIGFTLFVPALWSLVY